MSLSQNISEFSKYIRPFAMLVGGFLGLIILGFVIAGIFGFSLDTVMLIILTIFFFAMLVIAFKTFA